MRHTPEELSTASGDKSNGNDSLSSFQSDIDDESTVSDLKWDTSWGFDSRKF